MQPDTSSDSPARRGADIRTFLFADVRGYTRFTHEYGDEAASALAARFADMVRVVAPAFEGELLELRGDEALCVFRSARQALRAAVELQRRFRTPTDEMAAFPIGVGMGLDAGEAVPTQGGYRGASLNLAARLCALAKPGEILATENVAHFAHRVDGLRLLEGRSATVKGMARPVRFVVVTPDEPLPPVPTPVVDRGRSRWLVVGVIAVLVLVVGAAAGLIFASGGSKSSAGLRGGVFAVVGQDGQASTPVSVGGGATGIATAGRIAWVPDYPTGQVLKVDTVSGTAVPVTVGSNPDAVAVGAGAVWVANAGDGTVSEVSPSAGKVVATIYVGNAPSGIVVADNAVWVTLSLDGAVAKINPATQRRVDTFPVGTDPTRIAFGSGKLWVTNEAVGTVTPIDPSTDRAESPIPVPGGPNGIVSGAGGVFVTNGLGGTVTRIDPGRNRIAWMNPAGADPQGVAVVGESLWVAAHASGQIVRLDPRTGAAHAPLTVGAEPLDLAAMGDRAAVTTTSLPGRHRGGTLTIASGPLATSIDPQSRWAWLAQPWQTFSMTNDGLVAFKRVPGPDGETVVADLATSLPAPTDNGRTYTFQLRRGIRYSTGAPVEASDIRYGIERSFAVNVGATHEPNLGATFYDNIVGAPTCTIHPRTCNLKRGISANNQTETITFHLRRADPDFLAKLAMPMAVAVPSQVPRHEMGTRPLPATGPYMIESYQPKTSAVLVRNPDFRQWSQDAQPSGYPNRIAWRVYKTGDQAALAVERGQADYLADDVSPSRLRQIESTYTAQTHPSSALVTHFIVLAGSNTLRNDLTARQAIAYAVNRHTIVNLLGGPLAAQPTCQLLPPNFPGYRPYCPYTAGTDHTEWTAADPATAQLLAKRSKSYGKTIWVEPGQYASNYLVRLLAGLGFKARLDPKGNHDDVWMPSTGFGEDYPGADDFLGFYTSPANTPRDLKRTLNKQLQGQYAGTLAWAAVDRRFARYLWVLPVATPQVLGFTARNVQNYLSAPVIENNRIIDQMWVK